MKRLTEEETAKFIADYYKDKHFHVWVALKDTIRECECGEKEDIKKRWLSRVIGVTEKKMVEALNNWFEGRPFKSLQGIGEEIKKNVRTSKGGYYTEKKFLELYKQEKQTGDIGIPTIGKKVGNVTTRPGGNKLGGSTNKQLKA